MKNVGGGNFAIWSAHAGINWQDFKYSIAHPAVLHHWPWGSLSRLLGGSTLVEIGTGSDLISPPGGASYILFVTPRGSGFPATIYLLRLSISFYPRMTRRSPNQSIPSSRSGYTRISL